MATRGWPGDDSGEVAREGWQGGEAPGLPRCGHPSQELQPLGWSLSRSRMDPPVRPGLLVDPGPGAPALTPRGAGEPASSGPEALGMGPPRWPVGSSGSGTPQAAGSSHWGTCSQRPASWAFLTTWGLEQRDGQSSCPSGWAGRWAQWWRPGRLWMGQRAAMSSVAHHLPSPRATPTEERAARKGSLSTGFPTPSWPQTSEGLHLHR